MKAQLITKKVIENLEGGSYAIFNKNKELFNVMTLTEKGDNEERYLYSDGSDNYESISNFKNCYIVPASEVKLNCERCDSQSEAYINGVFGRF